MTTQGLRIEYLSDHIEYADIVSLWIFNAFIKNIRDDLSLESVTSSIMNCSSEALPIRLIALLGEKCVGTVSLVQSDLKCRDYTPWLAALFVDNDYRKNGIGKELIDCAVKAARQLGYKEIYLRTEHASAYYRKLGWTYVEACTDSFNLEPDIFKRNV